MDLNGLRNIPPPAEAKHLALDLTSPAVVSRIVAGLFLCASGMYALSSGKKERSLGRMMLGTVLILSALLLF